MSLMSLQQLLNSILRIRNTEEMQDLSLALCLLPFSFIGRAPECRIFTQHIPRAGPTARNGFHARNDFSRPILDMSASPRKLL